MRRFRGWVCFVALIIFGASAAFAAETIEKHKTGKYSIEEQGMRALVWARVVHNYGGEVKPQFHQPIRDGELKWITRADPVTYQVVVPDSYQAGEPHGIMVYINSGEGGQLPRNYHELLSKHRLIAIGADKSGNKHATTSRHAMHLTPTAQR